MDHKLPVNPSWVRYKTPTSSQFKEVTHDPKSQTMYVNFRSNDSVYSYHPVLESQFQAMIDSPSAGSFFHKHFNKKKDNLKIKQL